MKINKAKFITKRTILWFITALVIIVFGVFGYLYINHKINNKANRSTSGSVNYGPATSDQQKNGTTIKSNSASSPSTSGSDQPATPTPIPGSTQKSVTITITSANQNGSTLQIRALIGAVENTGTCTLTLSQTGQQTITKTAGTQALASVSTCQGFDIPTSELSTGVWHVTITYNSPALTGATTKDITIQ
jgi:hypothetical protein